MIETLLTFRVLSRSRRGILCALQPAAAANLALTHGLSFPPTASLPFAAGECLGLCTTRRERRTAVMKINNQGQPTSDKDRDRD